MSQLEPRILLDDAEIKRVVTRICHEILERNPDTEHLALVGIKTGGDLLAQDIQKRIKELKDLDIPLGSLDITLYRDDLSEIGPQAQVKGSELSFDIKEKILILVDDVLYSGRTVRCALDALIDYGRPACIQLAVLVDRGHRELPIRADYVGKNIPTALEDDILVKFDANEGSVVVLKQMKKEPS